MKSGRLMQRERKAAVNNVCAAGNSSAVMAAEVRRPVRRAAEAPAINPLPRATRKGTKPNNGS